MKILVTGGAGFIGSHLCERLVGLGHSVVTIDDFEDYYPVKQKELNAKQISRKGVEIVREDLSEDISFLPDDFDIVYHLAGQPGISDKVPFNDFVKNNIIATHNLLEVCRKWSGLKMFINIATSSIYGLNATFDEDAPPLPASYYGVTKLTSEQLVLSYQRQGFLRACSFRLFSIYGPRERPDKLFPRLIKGILRDKPFPLYKGSKKHKRSFTYVSDAVDAFISVLDKLDRVEGEIFNIGSDKCISTGEAIAIVEDVAGKKAKVDLKPRRAGDQFITSANISKAKRVLGYAPKVSPAEGLRETFEWYKKYIKDLP